MRVLLHLLQKIYEHENDDSHRDTKILIFSNFTQWLVRLKKWIHEAFDSESNRLRISIMDGRQSYSKNRTLVEQFQDGTIIDIMLVSVKCGGLGITLTKAKYTIIFDHDHNPQKEVQSVARMHRAGQTKMTHIIQLHTVDSMDVAYLCDNSDKLHLLEHRIRSDVPPLT